MQSLETQSSHGVSFQPIFEKVGDARMLQSSIKSGATQSIDHAIRTLQNDRKLLANNSELKPVAKAIDKEIKNLKSLKKTIGKTKLETGDQALMLSAKVQDQIQKAANNVGDRKVIPTAGLKTLDEMATRFDSVVTKAGATLNKVVQKEFDTIPTQQLTFKEKIDKILKQILNLVVRDPKHAELSQVEKRANSLEKLCKQKDAAIVADLRKGMPIEKANREAVGKVNEEMHNFKSLLIGSTEDLRSKYTEQRDAAIDDLRKNNSISRQLTKGSTLVATSSAVIENLSERSIEQQNKALKDLHKETSNHLNNLNRELAKLTEGYEVEDLEAGFNREEKERRLAPMTDLVALVESVNEDLEVLQDAIKDAEPDERTELISSAQNDFRKLGKEIESARTMLIGDADRRLKDAEAALRALEGCCSDEWPGLDEPNYRDKKSVDTYVKEMKSRVDKGMAFFFNQRA